MKKILFFTALIAFVFFLPVFVYADNTQTATLTITISPQGAIDAGCGSMGSKPGAINAGEHFSVSPDFRCDYKGASSGVCSGIATGGATYNCILTYVKKDTAQTNTDTSNLMIVRVAKRITDFVWKVFALIAVIMFVVAGMLFFFARGEAEGLKTARAAVVWGVVGAVIAILSFSMISILRFFLGA